jgi:ketosteroid isomerase-like protein
VSLPPAAALVDRYLRLCEERRLDEAAALLAPGARLVFPGGVTYPDLQAMVAGARRAYRWVRKPERQYAAAPGVGDTTTVTCRGTLTGEWLDGRPFAGIRFVDVLVLRGGLIAEQHVFNDLAIAARAAAAVPEQNLETMS